MACGAIMGALVLALVACQKRADTAQPSPKSSAPSVQKETPAVGLFDMVGLWATATAEKGTGQFKGTISLGEVVTLTGEEEMGKSYGGEAHKFYKVKTSVDDVGWVQELYFAVNARPAVITKETLRYQRDNPTSALGSDKVPPMTVVALLEEKGDWVQIKFGGRKDVPFLTSYAAQDFWIKKDTISVSEQDVTVAVLGLRALFMDSADAKAEALKVILDDSSYGDSEFVSLLRKELAKAQGKDEVQVNVDVD
jgi:hypothetical protein